MVGDARIVSLGEATHGSREFFQMKHRVLEFLVEEMGFTTFGIEAPWAESNGVNDFVRTGEGDPAALLSNLNYWTWNTREVLDMILWMEEHNRTTPTGQGVDFFGFDMVYSQVAMDMVWDYVAGSGTGGTSVVGPGYTCWRTWSGATTYPGAPAGTKEWCRDGVRSVYEHLLESRDAYVSATSEDEYAVALRAARIVVQHEHRHSLTNPGHRLQARDAYMAENAHWLLERAGPDGRIVLWAHNWHVRQDWPWMGWHLREWFGDEMVTVGFSFHRGAFNARPREAGSASSGPLTSHEAPPAISGSYEDSFQALGLPRFAVDLRPLRDDPPPEAAWLLGPLPFRSIGAAYDPSDPAESFRSESLPEQYDVIIHFEKTEASELLPFVN